MDKIEKKDDDWLDYSKDYMKIRFSSDDNLSLIKKCIQNLFSTYE